ncbi:hypothetical protein DMH18_35310 [Streptomyces sp. WAC 06783]|nr:hypothetical protein DMH18_35310 [Streptomyces sp. WAC 06783]
MTRRLVAEFARRAERPARAPAERPDRVVDVPLPGPRVLALRDRRHRHGGEDDGRDEAALGGDRYGVPATPQEGRAAGGGERPAEEACGAAAPRGRGCSGRRRFPWRGARCAGTGAAVRRRAGGACPEGQGGGARGALDTKIERLFL